MVIVVLGQDLLDNVVGLYYVYCCTRVGIREDNFRIQAGDTAAGPTGEYAAVLRRGDKSVYWRLGAQEDEVELYGTKTVPRHFLLRSALKFILAVMYSMIVYTNVQRNSHRRLL